MLIGVSIEHFPMEPKCNYFPDEKVCAKYHACRLVIPEQSELRFRLYSLQDSIASIFY